MTGPEHYLAGERHLDRCSKMIEGIVGRARTAAEAQAHLTAALVACLAISQHPESVAWDKAVSQ